MWLSAMQPKMETRFLNTGKNGNRIRDLRKRSQKDTLKLRSGIVSILIGVNDTLGKLNKV